MSIIADVVSIGSAIFIVGFAAWMTMQLLKSTD
jgi:hypothetical protein